MSRSTARSYTPLPRCHGHVQPLRAAAARCFGTNLAGAQQRVLLTTAPTRPACFDNSVSACCSHVKIGAHAAALFSGSSLTRAIARYHCTPVSRASGETSSAVPACLARCDTTWVYTAPTSDVRSSVSRSAALSRMLGELRAQSLPRPSLVLDDFNGLHLLHMHPFDKPCCRPWIDGAAPGGEADCWQHLARWNRNKTTCE